MTTLTTESPVDERDRRWEAGEPAAQIAADFRSRGIDPDAAFPITTYVDLAADRWKTITHGIDTVNAESADNSAVMGRYMDATRQILARMIHGVEDDAEYTLLCEAEGRLLERLADEAEALVVAVETSRRTTAVPA